MFAISRTPLPALAWVLALGLTAPGCGDDDDGGAYQDCSSVCYDAPATGSCACSWECAPEEVEIADFEVHCVTAGDALECTCFEEEAETGSFESDDFCDVEHHEPQANAGCGWHLG